MNRQPPELETCIPDVYSVAERWVNTRRRAVWVPYLRYHHGDVVTAFSVLATVPPGYRVGMGGVVIPGKRRDREAVS